MDEIRYIDEVSLKAILKLWIELLLSTTSITKEMKVNGVNEKH
jgi:hypothetical protein